MKGSTYGRTTTDADEKATKKDNNFLQRKPFYLESDDREKLLRIIYNDSRFFAEHNIIDYSLLVGVVSKSNSSQIRKLSHSSSLHESASHHEREDCKMYESPDKTEKYLIGIIDILTLFDTRKKMEYCIKRILHGNGISAIPPH